MRYGLVVSGLLAAMLLQEALSSRLLTATFDETTHLPSGYTYLRTGDFRLNPQHPPLIKLLCALPLIPIGPRLDISDPAWSARPPDEWRFGYRFLYSNDADRLLLWGRMPVMLLSLLLAFYVQLWARRLFGPAAGLVALALCAFSPTVLAHARFVTFDLALACFSTIVLYHLWRWARGAGGSHLAWAGIGLGLALATKYSALILAAVIPVLTLGAAVLPGRGGASGSSPQLKRAIFRAGLALVVIGVLALLIVQATYFFSSDPLIYLKGLRQVNADHDPDFPYYLMGGFKTGGWWYYFLLAFLFKTPLPTLILFGLSLFLLRRHAAVSFLDEAFLVLPIVLYAVATSAYADNLGIRYLLPVYPLIFVFVSRTVLAVSGRRWVGAAAVVLALWYAGGTLAVYPDHLAYFNEIVGGPAGGHAYLDDSNIDWGQDVKRLRDYLERRGIESVKLRLPPNASPTYYGIRWQPITDADWAGTPPPGVYAMSTHLLIRGEYHARQRGLKTDWLKRYRPVGRVGYSIYVFEF